MMSAMQRDWARLGAALKAGRNARGTNQVDMGERIGVGRSAVQNIERGDIKKISPAIRAYAREIGWTADSIESVLTGGEPELEPPTPAPAETPAVEAPPADLPLRIVRELEEGQLLDSTVIPLSDDGDGRMVIVVRGQPDATPEQIRRALLVWEQRETQLQSLDDQPPSAEEA